jgi:transcriptional regulator with XRE-family HTH domain
MWLDQGLYKILGLALTEAREKARLTQQDLAQRLRKPQSFVSNYENGQRRVDILELIHIADTLGADPQKLFADVLTRHKHRKTRK